MSQFTPTRLFDLLPQIYRIRDADAPSNGALEALLNIADAQVEIVRADIAQLWDNFFVETCDDWVVPYIGDLVGANLVAPITLRARTDVAKTIHYRRRKGTVPMLEELARDVTGWSAKVVEFFQILGWTQNANHVRFLPLPSRTGLNLGKGGWFDIHDDAICSAVGTAFDLATHTVDVRVPAQAEGSYNIRNIGFFLWRLQAYSLVNADPRNAGQPHHFHFNSLGQPLPLFIQPDIEGLVERATDEDNVRGPINPRRLEAVMLSIDHAGPPDAGGLVALHLIPPDAPLAQSWVAGLWLELIDPADATKTLAATLVDVRERGATLIVQPDSTLTSQTRVRAFPNLQTYYGTTRGMSVYADGNLISPLAANPYKRRVLIGDLCDWNDPAPGTLVIDVRLGRFAFTPGETPAGRITVNYNYGFSGDIGAGPYARAVSGAPTIVVSKAGATTKLQDALNAWDPNANPQTVIEIADSATYEETLAPLTLPNAPTFQLTIRAASGERPTILLGGDWQLNGTADTSSLTLEGLLVSGGKIDLQGTLAQLNIRNCTLDPGGGLASDGVILRPMQQSLVVSTVNDKLKIVIDRSIVGALRIPDAVTDVLIDNSIVDAQGSVAISGLSGANDYAARATIRATTIFGKCWLNESTLGSEVLFDDETLVLRKQNGCVRFSYIHPGSDMPRRYACLPPDGASATELARLVPMFTSTRFGDPGYAQLSRACPREIATGASDGSEIGAFYILKNPLREQNLRMRLEEYLPFGLAAALIDVT